MGFVVLALAATACPAPPGGTSGTHVVTTAADITDAGDGLLSLREAVVAAGADNVSSLVRVSSGVTYSLTDCSAGQLFHGAAESLTIEAQGTGRAIIDQTCPDARVMSLSGGSTTLSRLVVTGGAPVSGSMCGLYFNPPCKKGGAVLSSAPLSVTDSRFEANTTVGPGFSGNASGGAISASSSLTVSDSEFVGNTASLWGGAIAAEGPLTVAGSSFSANASLRGNAIDAAGGTATISESQFVSNIGSSGGAVSTHGSSLDVSATVFRSNSSGGGPGSAIWAESSTGHITLDSVAVVSNTGRTAAIALAGGPGVFTARNSTISDNVATGNFRDQYNPLAGGIDLSSSWTVNLVGTTVAHNSAMAGGGANIDAVPSATAAINLVDSILANPVGGGLNCSASGLAVASVTSFVSDGSCGVPMSPGSVDLGPLGALGSTWVRVPGVSSVARDAHGAPCSTTTDQLGGVRPQGSGCDLGAVEQ